MNAMAPDVRLSSSAIVSTRDAGTLTLSGVGAMSSSVPSTSRKSDTNRRFREGAILSFSSIFEGERSSTSEYDKTGAQSHGIPRDRHRNVRHQRRFERRVPLRY